VNQLPELSSFSALQQGNAVVLEWATNNDDSNILGWNIIRYNDTLCSYIHPTGGCVWSVGMLVNAQLIPRSTTHSYFCADSSVAADEYFYKLETINHDGSKGYSWFVAVTVVTAIYDRPNQDISKIHIWSRPTVLYDLQGRKVSLTSLSNSIYFDQSMTAKFVVINGKIVGDK
jgi:hypothetical protein